MSASQPTDSDVEIDVRALLGALWRKLFLVLVFVLLVGAGTYYLLTQVPPVYLSEATVLIEQGETDLTRTDQTGTTPAVIDREAVTSQVQQILSRDLGMAVATRLDLASRDEFNPPPERSWVNRILAMAGLPPIVASSSSVEETVLDHYFQKLSVYAIDNSRVISINFSSEDPRLAADVANAIATEYITLQAAAKRDNTADAAQWLSAQIFDLRGKVQAAEANIERFRAENDLFSAGGTLPATLPQQQLADLNAELSRVRAARAEAEAKAAQIRAALDSGTALNASDVINSPLIQRLVEQQVALRTQMADLNATLLPQHPRMRAIAAQLADLDRQIAAEAKKVLQASESDARLAEAREAQIATSLSRLKATAATANDASVELRALEREAAAQRDLLESYLARYREALAREQSGNLPADARIISRATVPITPNYPRKVPMTAAVMTAAFLLAVAFVLLRELASGRPMRRISYAVPALPVVPDAVPVSAHSRWADDHSVRRMMATEPTLVPEVVDRVEASLAVIARNIVTSGDKRVIVTLADGSDSDGRPLGAVALARALARTDARVVLVDFRSDGANAASMGEGQDLPGFADLFDGQASFAQVIFRDRKSRVHFIPAGRKPLAPGGINQEQLETILSALTLTYDYVVFDAADEMIPVISPACAAAVVVSEFGPADPRTVKAFDRIKNASEARIMLLVVDPSPDDEPADRETSGAAA